MVELFSILHEEVNEQEDKEEGRDNQVAHSHHSAARMGCEEWIVTIPGRHVGVHGWQSVRQRFAARISTRHAKSQHATQCTIRGNVKLLPPCVLPLPCSCALASPQSFAQRWFVAEEGGLDPEMVVKHCIQHRPAARQQSTTRWVTGLVGWSVSEGRLG